MSIGTGIATGKIILMGEHSVVYGEPALLSFAGAKVQVEITANETNTLISSYYHGLLEEVPSHLKCQRLAASSATRFPHGSFCNLHRQHHPF